MILLRHYLRYFRAVLYRFSGILWLAERRLAGRGAILILGLHRVLEDGGFAKSASLSGMMLRKRTFTRMIDFLASNFQIADPAKVLPGEERGITRFVLTFDDGWEDNYSTVFPIVRTRRVPMTVFVCPACLGQIRPFWPERLAAAIRATRPAAHESEIEPLIERFKPYPPEIREKMMAPFFGDRPFPNSNTVDRTLSWAQFLVMKDSGVQFGAHTQTHQVLTALSPEAARPEIFESKQTLDEAGQTECRLFAYPNGNHATWVRELVKEAGFSLAFTTEPGAWTAQSDPLAIPRINVAESDVTDPLGRFSPTMFLYATVWKARRAGGEA